MLQSAQMVEEFEFLNENFKETLTSCLIRCVDGALESGYITVLQSFFSINELKVPSGIYYSLPPVLLIFSRVATQSLS
jgi:hypothetical protein